MKNKKGVRILGKKGLKKRVEKKGVRKRGEKKG